MASVTIQHSHKNLIFAAAVANVTGAEFEEQGERAIIISDSPELTIPRYEFDEIFDADNRNTRADHAWRSLLLNKRGYLKYFDDHEIVLCDDPPKQGQANFLLRFPTAAEKRVAEEWAERLGYGSLTEYILSAIDSFNQSWQEKAK